MPTRRPRPAATAASMPLLGRNGEAQQGQPRIASRKYLRHISLVVLVLFLCILFLYVRQDPPPPKNSDHFGEPFVRRIVAVGDLHGDYDNALEVLQMAHVVDVNGSWTGKVDFFVQTGDIVDRGVDTIKLYAWMERLREQAHEAGGEVFSHLGNHEFMNAMGDWRYVLQADIATFGSVEKRQAALSTGSIGAAWAQNYSVVSRVPLHPFSGMPFADYTPSSPPSPLSHASISFMHGGLSPVYTEKHGTPYPSAINSVGRSLLRRCQTRKPQPQPHPPGPYTGLPPGSIPAEEALYDTNGPLWYRGWATDSEGAVCSRVGHVMEKIGVRRMIMGHTPNFEKIVSRCGGKIIIIDTGISKAYGGALSALSITYTLTPIMSSFDNTSPIDRSDGAPPSHEHNPSLTSQSTNKVGSPGKGKGPGKWLEKEEIIALYPTRRVRLVVHEREVEGDFW